MAAFRLYKVPSYGLSCESVFHDCLDAIYILGSYAFRKLTNYLVTSSKKFHILELSSAVHSCPHLTDFTAILAMDYTTSVIARVTALLAVQSMSKVWSFQLIIKPQSGQ
jgi:hypothetical protein